MNLYNRNVQLEREGVVRIVELSYKMGSFKDHVMKYLAAWQLHDQRSKGVLTEEDLCLFAEMLAIDDYVAGYVPDDLKKALGLDQDAA